MKYQIVLFGQLYAEQTRNGLNRPKSVRGSGIKMINMGEIFEHRILNNAHMDLVPFDYSKEERFLVLPGDLLFARQSLVLEGAGKCVLFAGDNQDVTFESHITRVRLNQKIACPKYVFYFFESRLGKDTMSTIVEQGAGAAGIRGSQLETLPIPLPPLPVQRRIADILGALDDKIELNRRMNATLEAMARALFKSWFVDFDPVHAKAAGQPTGLPAHIDALFPSAFIDSPLGQIPQGWGVGKVGDLVELKYGKTLKAEQRLGGSIKVYGSNGVVGWHNEKLVSGPGIIVGRKGTAGSVTWSHTDFYPIDTTFYATSCKNDYSIYYVYYTLSLMDLPGMTSDSAVPGLNIHHAHNRECVIPPSLITQQFEHFSSAYFEKMNVLDESSQTIHSLRDTLLPKLLSGEVEV